jgi:hypothetical protein
LKAQPPFLSTDTDYSRSIIDLAWVRLMWCVQKVLVVDRFAGKPQLIRYVPGHWERVLMDAPKVAAGSTGRRHESGQRELHI